jgi:FkbM family methyltransferase
MKVILKIAARVTGNSFWQTRLQELSAATNYLRGFGGGGEAAVYELLPPQPVIFDVGANRGNYARAAMSRHPDAIIHCFEPSRKTFELLGQQLDGTGAALNNFGLGDQDAQLTLFSPTKNSALASLSRRRLDHFGIPMDQEETVTIKTLDGYCRDRDIKKIDLLKLDVEGHELSVLRGGIELLKARRIGLIVFEFGGCNIDSRTFLNIKSLERLSPRGKFIPVLGYTQDLECFMAAHYLVRF